MDKENKGREKGKRKKMKEKRKTEGICEREPGLFLDLHLSSSAQ
jgi:hypothetical protein